MTAILTFSRSATSVSHTPILSSTFLTRLSMRERYLFSSASQSSRVSNGQLMGHYVHCIRQIFGQ